MIVPKMYQSASLRPWFDKLLTALSWQPMGLCLIRKVC
jgi:hypothetical protein